jgi:hypothetical protein
MLVKVGTGKKQSGFLKLNKSKSEPVDMLVEAVEDYEEDVPDKEKVPIKCVSTVMNYLINWGIHFIDFDGITWRLVVQTENDNMEQNNSISKPMMVARKDTTGQTIPMMVVSKDTTTTRQTNRIAKPMMVSKTDTPDQPCPGCLSARTPAKLYP